MECLFLRKFVWCVMKNIYFGFRDVFFYEHLYDVLWRMCLWVLEIVFFEKICMMYYEDFIFGFEDLCFLRKYIHMMCYEDLFWFGDGFFSKHLWYIMCYEDFSFVFGGCLLNGNMYDVLWKIHFYENMYIMCHDHFCFVLVGDCFFTNIYVMNHEDSFGFGNCSQKIVWCAIKIVFSGFGNCFLMKIYMVYHVNIRIYIYTWFFLTFGWVFIHLLSLSHVLNKLIMKICFGVWRHRSPQVTARVHFEEIDGV